MAFIRAELKNCAKEQLAGKWGSAIGAFVLISIVSGFIAILMNRLVVYNEIIWSPMVSLLIFIISIGSIFVNCPLQFGWTRLTMLAACNRKFEATTPFWGFRRTIPVVLLYLVMGIFIFLWLLLLIVPGIIKAYSYMMAPYIMNDDENISPFDAITKSREMMDGYKLELFVLQLSFFPWMLLSAVTFGLAGLYVFPYMEVTMANFYFRLRDERNRSFGGGTSYMEEDLRNQATKAAEEVMAASVVKKENDQEEK